MAWSWSHTPEAYANARANLDILPFDTLREIAAEWEAAAGELEYSEARYQAARDAQRTLPADVLIDRIWERAEEQATCDNGGHSAWVCPYGCHTVSFTRDPGPVTA